MNKTPRERFEHIAILQHLLKWTALAIPVSLATGSLVALFLWLLDLSVHFRWTHRWLLYGLPLAGILIHWLYRFAGKQAEGGNNLIMDEIHEPGGGVPARMAPLVLATTLITHLFGGSAGREGTAVQMGGSVAGFFARRFRLSRQELRILLMSGIAAGFGAVFGTPVAGAVFALEVLVTGNLQYDALMPCFIASMLADITCRAWGIQHTLYTVNAAVPGATTGFLHVDMVLLLKTIGAGVLFGLAGYLFSWLSHTVKKYSSRLIPVKWLIPVTGGLIIIAGARLLGTEDYLSLGVTQAGNQGVSIVSSFHAGGAETWSWLWKLLFTVVTLGTGFKGGEVTPLFFIGATLGNAIAMQSGAPVDLMAALGFIAVFAAATNTPLACTIMGAELFGGHYLFYYAVACFTAYYFSGHTGIYLSQRRHVSKSGSVRNAGVYNGDE